MCRSRWLLLSLPPIRFAFDFFGMLGHVHCWRGFTGPATHQHRRTDCTKDWPCDTTDDFSLGFLLLLCGATRDSLMNNSASNFQLRFFRQHAWKQVEILWTNYRSELMAGEHYLPSSAYQMRLIKTFDFSLLPVATIGNSPFVCTWSKVLAWKDAFSTY